MRKLVMLLLALAVVVAGFSLAGCGGGKDSAPAAPAAKEESLADILSKGKKVTGMSYDFIMTNGNNKMTGTMWMEGKKARTELTMQNQKMISIIDGDANVMYSYMPEQKAAMKMPIDNSQKPETPSDYSRNIDAAKTKVLETTTYEGVKCKVLLITRAEDKAESKIWLREDYGVPMRVETTVTEGNKVVMEYKNMKFGPVPPETFQLPAGTKITDMSQMMKQVAPKQ